jgi:hypothetical protein
MRARSRMLALGGLAIGISAGGLAAAPAERAPASWADWVGDYRGAVTWRGCVAPGAASAVVAIDAVDAVIAVDLAALGGGLRAMSLLEDGGGWSARDGDVAVRIERSRPAAPGAIELAVTLDSGCTARGRLARAATGVPACDRLAGWSRIEARCRKLAARGGAPLEDAARIAGTKWRAADAAACDSRAARVELALIDAGCAPHPDPAIGARAPDCLRLADDAARAARAGCLPPDLEATLVREAQALRAASETAERATLGVVEQQCRDARATLATAAARFRCPR